jgi:hypothetical protein
VQRFSNSFNQLDATELDLVTLCDNERRSARRRGGLLTKYFGQAIPIGHDHARWECGVLGKTGSYERETAAFANIRNDRVRNIHRCTVSYISTICVVRGHEQIVGNVD